VYRSTHRGEAGLTVARTIPSPRGARCSDIVFNQALLTPDLTRVRVSGFSGSAARFLAHEFLHAGVRIRGEPSTPATADRSRFWDFRTWKILDEHRVEKALCRTWPQDIDYIGAYVDLGTDFLAGLRAPSIDPGRHVLRHFPVLCETFAYAIAAAAATATHLSRLTGLASSGLLPTTLVDTVLAVPDALEPTAPEVLIAHSENIQHALQGWLEDWGYRLEAPGGGAIAFSSI
jgi:hypothetical protein